MTVARMSPKVSRPDAREAFAPNVLRTCSQPGGCCRCEFDPHAEFQLTVRLSRKSLLLESFCHSPAFHL
jgi:hypothetical protein